MNMFSCRSAWNFYNVWLMDTKDTATQVVMAIYVGLEFVIDTCIPWPWNTAIVSVTWREPSASSWEIFKVIFVQLCSFECCTEELTFVLSIMGVETCAEDFFCWTVSMQPSQKASILWGIPGPNICTSHSYENLPVESSIVGWVFSNSSLVLHTLAMNKCHFLLFQISLTQFQTFPHQTLIVETDSFNQKLWMRIFNLITTTGKPLHL